MQYVKTFIPSSFCKAFAKESSIVHISIWTPSFAIMHLAVEAWSSRRHESISQVRALHPGPLGLDNEPGDFPVAQCEAEVKIGCASREVSLQVVHHVVAAVAECARTGHLDRVGVLTGRW